MAIFYALGNLLCATFSDLGFKFYTRRHDAIGSFVLIIGLVWTFFCLFLALNSGGLILDSVTLFWGCLSGLLGVVANLLFISSMKYQDVSVAATIYRLNFVLAAMLGVWLLGESLSLYKLTGLLLAIFAVTLFFSRPEERKSSVEQGLWSVILASIFRGCLGIALKEALIEGADMYSLLVLSGVGWVLGGWMYGKFIEKHQFKLEKSLLTYGVITGLFISGIVWCLMMALSFGEVSIVIPITQLSFILTAIVGILFLKETFTIRKGLGMISAMICVGVMALA